MSAVSDTQEAVPRHFGDYELIEEIGRGGMGVIFKAHQHGLERLCAIKMLKSGRGADPEERERLREEAKAAARLDHPNIVGIYDVGQVDGQLFFSMELVEGENIAAFVRSRTLSAEKIATYAKKVAEAVHYAHSRGVLHCDLKPANVLIDNRDEPQITDFGLARREGRGAGADSDFGAGSPNFMAPEQASTKFGPIGPQTDVFGIGATLYYLLTDRPPFRGEKFADTLNAVIRTDPVRPRTLRPGVPLDLETICIRCLEKRPAKRYRTAQEVADELGRFLRDEPIHARPISFVERAWRFARRHPTLSAFAAATTTLLAVIAIGSPIATYHIHLAKQAAETQRELAEKQRARAEANEERIRGQLYAANMLDACQAAESGNIQRAMEHLAKYDPAIPGAAESGLAAPDLRGWEWRYLASLSRSDGQLAVPTNGGAIVDVAFFRDSQHLVTLDARGVLSLRDLSNKSEVRRFESGGRTNWMDRVLAVSPDGSRVAFAKFDAATTNSTLWVIDSSSWQSIGKFTLAGGVVSIDFTPDGGRLIVPVMRIAGSSVEGDILSVSPDGRDQVKLAELPPSRRHGQCAFSPDMKLVAYGNDDATLSVRRLDGTGTEKRLIGHDPEPGWLELISSLRFSPDGKLLASTAVDKTARLWDVDTGRELAVLRGHDDVVLISAFSPDQRLLVTAGRDRTLRLWEVATGRQVGVLRGGSASAAGLAFSPNGELLISVTRPGEVNLWNYKSALSRTNLAVAVPEGIVWAEVLPDARHWWSSTDAMDWTLYRLGESRPIFQTFDTNLALIHAKSYHAGTDQIALYRQDGSLTLRNLSTSSERRFAGGKPSLGATVGFSLDGGLVGVGVGLNYMHGLDDSTNSVLVWRTDTGQLIREFKGPSDELVFSRDNRYVATCDVRGYVQLNNLETGVVRPLGSHGTQVHGMAFSPDGKLLASGSTDGVIKLWNTDDGSEKSSFQTQTTGVLAVEFSPDGGRLVCGTLDGYLQVWDLATGLKVAAFRQHRQPIGSVFFADADTIVTGGLDQIRTWRAGQARPAGEIN
jgi:WD40 repeat protein/predicted Ser/Thr protein kinase